MSRKLIVIAAVLVLLASTLASIVVGHHHEPVYHGKPLSWWLLQTTNGAREGLFRGIGTNTLPDLIQILRSKDWPYRPQVVAWVQRRELLKSKLKFGLSADDTKSRALIILGELGPPARAALPEVLSLLTNQTFRHKSSAIFAVSGMALTDQELRPLLPILSKSAADPSFAGGIAGATRLLYGFKLPRSETLIIACELLKSPGASVRQQAVEFLNKMQPPPTEAVPDLCRLLNDPDLAVRKAAWDCRVVGPSAYLFLTDSCRMRTLRSFVRRRRESVRLVPRRPRPRHGCGNCAAAPTPRFAWLRKARWKQSQGSHNSFGLTPVIRVAEQLRPST
jgi:hypothetical protein